MKIISRQVAMIFLMLMSVFPLHSEVIDEIYAVVNEEILTYTEFQNAKNALIMQLKSKFKGEELQIAMKDIDKNIMNQLIDFKLILSRAKEKKYDIDSEIKMIIEEIKKQNNLKSDEDLRAALRSEGITMEEFKKQQGMVRMQQRMIYEEVTSKIKIENPEIMEYYKKNMPQFTQPLELTLNCIFLNKASYFTQNALQAKRKEISDQLSPDNFLEVAKKYSELEGPENNYFLGHFKKGELNEAIEKEALKLQTDEYSPWIETDNGWYIVQLVKRTEEKLIDYKEVREKIKNILLQRRQGIELKKLLDQLKKESYIKIYKKIDGVS
jgi:peptidyl-prolyl cis-trans isomerase SurA